VRTGPKSPLHCFDQAWCSDFQSIKKRFLHNENLSSKLYYKIHSFNIFSV